MIVITFFVRTQVDRVEAPPLPSLPLPAPPPSCPPGGNFLLPNIICPPEGNFLLPIFFVLFRHLTTTLLTKLPEYMLEIMVRLKKVFHLLERYFYV